MISSRLKDIVIPACRDPASLLFLFFKNINQIWQTHFNCTFIDQLQKEDKRHRTRRKTLSDDGQGIEVLHLTKKGVDSILFIRYIFIDINL